MQIKSLVLYGKNNEVRQLDFKLGQVNIITGMSKTGKSVIGDIIEYCFGRNSCNIAEGVVRDTVAWYGLHLCHGDKYLFIARENPSRGHSSTNTCLYSLNMSSVPTDLKLLSPIDNESLVNVLTRELGISENQFIPASNQTRNPLSANIKHTMYYLLQNQDEIASQKFIFHRQSEPFQPQAIKDTILYFLGIINENAMTLESERTRLKRETTLLQKSIRENELLRGNGLNRATQLIEEARNVGLLSSTTIIDYTDFDSLRSVLLDIQNWEPTDVEIAGLDRLSALQTELEKVQADIDRISIEIRNSEEYLGQVKGYNTEILHQKNRLASIGLFDALDFNENHCPFCSRPTDASINITHDIKNSIEQLSESLSSVTTERPNIRKHIDGLIDARENFKEARNRLMSEIEAFYNANNDALSMKDLNSRRSKVLGRISLWLESVVIETIGQSDLDRLAELEYQINEIDKALSQEDVLERKESCNSIISAWINVWAKELNLEHSEFPYRFDMNKLTIIVDRDRPVPLEQLGSGANWLGSHLITLFAFHKYFISYKRPVPGFLFLDQPSQVYFPPETRHENVDSSEIREIYRFIFDKVNDLNGGLQVIIVDHADIDEEYFQDAVLEKWWDGTKLIPQSWIQ
ncbi:DUF3732 domain-containing protein [Fusibacter ferrireducens]|uniref:DUF3732 domain-containing protein n=1 Tax=Fusibacter ferrireducens TaxID=2785058 RepID=A0ABR9ZU52_9FIRM|nr:DUF3732 domain-containing protein [Fusibacter ferrireducens]MBF4693977.1 DUF3732 domain-containing protein [Fusibacter ferrireducens]